jgi:hypothetical protein
MTVSSESQAASEATAPRGANALLNFLAFAVVLISASISFFIWLFVMVNKLLITMLFIALPVGVVIFILRDTRGIKSLIAAILILPIELLVGWMLLPY